MKKLLVLIVIFCVQMIYSQSTRGFGGASLYLDREFYRSSFAELSLGVEYKINQTIRPEIEASVFFGSLQDRTHTNEQDALTDKLYRSFIATNITVCAKICIGDHADEIGTPFFQILPMYSLTKVMAKESLLTINPNDASKSTTDIDRYSEIRHSLGIGVGVYINGSKKYNNSLALNLYYTGINFGNSFSNLKLSNGTSYKTDVLGLGIKFYFSFTKRKEKKS
jgi:hypothetical protein